MSESIDWDMLQNQYISNTSFCDTLSKLCKIVDDPFACDLSRIPGVCVYIYMQQKLSTKIFMLSSFYLSLTEV